MTEEDKPIGSVVEYLNRISEISKINRGEFAFRGLGDDSYLISSGAARRLNVFKSIREEMDIFKNYHRYLISNAKMKGFNMELDQKLNEFELLAMLQHYGAATGLIDFSRSSLVALYFATINMDQNKPKKGTDLPPLGVVYIINIQNSSYFKKVDSNDIEKPFLDFLEDTNKYWVWEPSDLNNRIPKQHSLFVFGKPVLDNEYTNSIKIDPNEKGKILDELAEFHNIKADSLFNDLPGFAKANSYDKYYIEDEILRLLNLADEARSLGKEKEQMYYLEEAYKRNKKNRLVLFVMANAKSAIGDHKGAEEAYKELLEISPDIKSLPLLITKEKFEQQKNINENQ